MGRRALIHKQSARGFVCSRQGSQAAPRTSGPNCLRRGRCGRCGRLCHCFVPSAHRTVANPPSDPAGDSLPFSKYADRHGIPSPASQVLHSIPRPAHLADRAWSPPGCQRSRAGRGALGGSKCNGSFPSWRQGISAGNRSA